MLWVVADSRRISRLALAACWPAISCFQRSHWDWSTGSDHRPSVDDSTYGSHNALSKGNSQQLSPIEIESLKTKLAALARQVDVSDLELQTLKQKQKKANWNLILMSLIFFMNYH
ncbi:hypothetical protein VNO77_00932 [Canavalia gladiata]|uniref:Uncharacterized protein n=1 Tax=Canavalia gladiata TaxID=3824 RepID=A0AAN9MV02_CANGL